MSTIATTQAELKPTFTCDMNRNAYQMVLGLVVPDPGRLDYSI